MTKVKKHTHPIVNKLVRLRILLLVVSFIAIFAIIYLYSSESKQPFIGHPKDLNSKLLDQEIENAELVFIVDSLIKENKKLVLDKENIDGIIFEVQIGAFEDLNMEKFEDDLEILNYTTDGGADYITLGKFRDIDDAKLFIVDLQKIGISNATIISKLDGKRVRVRE